MKQLLFLSGIFLFLSCVTTKNGGAIKQKETFAVHGNCGMCKTTIETSLAYVPGIYWSDWDIETKQITVKFNPEKIALEKIKERIAAVGYDNDTHRAKDEVYQKLHGCCKYERP